MAWEVRISLEVRKGIYQIERGVAAIITDGIETLAKEDHPIKDAKEIENTEAKKLDSPAYEIEIHAHFVTFQPIEEENRKILKIIEVQ